MISEIIPKKHVRIIPRLDIKGSNLVKGVHMEGLRVLGTPHHFAKYYYENGADELFYQDVVASLYGRNSMEEIIRKTASEIFIPLTVSGGIKTIDDIKEVLRCGADKVAINTAAVRNKKIVRQASEKFGSSTIVVSIEAIKQTNGKYLAYTDNGREHTGIDAIEWAEEAVDLGAGELVITSVDQEGTGSGFEIDLVQKISSRIGVPVIAHGGAGSTRHILELFKSTNADAVSVASLFHYNLIDNKKVSKEIKRDEGNTEFLKMNRRYNKFDLCEISHVKNMLLDNRFIVRE